MFVQKSLQVPGERSSLRAVLFGTTEEDTMKKFGYVLAALGAIVIAAPTIASAETIVIKRGGHHHGYGARAEMHRDNGWHRGWRHGHDRRVVVIKKSHHRY
jgi:hypothetical protein